MIKQSYFCRLSFVENRTDLRDKTRILRIQPARSLKRQTNTRPLAREEGKIETHRFTSLFFIGLMGFTSETTRNPNHSADQQHGVHLTVSGARVKRRKAIVNEALHLAEPPLFCYAQ